jgi:hypothetical protein
MDTIMGSLKPGATLIYERANGVVYVRESGKKERSIVGYEHDSRTPDGRPLLDHMMEDKLWGNIRRAAKSNPALQDALDRVIIVYNLNKPNE